MTHMATPSSEMIPQLEAARQLVLADAQIYSQILPGILPIIGPAAPLEVRRWGAEFLAESFASPALPQSQKEELGVVVLPTLRGMLEAPGEDAAVVKSVVQTLASLYALIFRRIISRPDESVWQNMSAMKSNILKRMDSTPIGVRVCCIKFVQRVVQVQTPGVVDPRRPEQSETSVALVPRNHPLLPLPILEAEASGLLDRLLDVFHESSSDPILIDATLNCMSTLIRSRPPVANKVISAILNFNPLKETNSPMTPRIKVMVKSMERTTRALLKNILKNSPNGPQAAKIDAYLVRLNQARTSIFSDSQPLKRPAPSGSQDGPDSAKRPRLGAAKFPLLPPPPNSVAQLFTLTEDAGLIAFDAKMLPVDMISTITALTLQHVDQHALDEATGAIRARYTHLQKMQQPTPVPAVPMAGPTGIDDEDDYDPEYDSANEDTSGSITETSPLQNLAQPDIALGPFELPKPPPLTEPETALLSKQVVDRVFGVMTSLDVTTQANLRQKLGLNRLAASTNDRDAWVTMMSRLATRAPSGLDDLVSSEMDSDDADRYNFKTESGAVDVDKPSLANGIRQTLYLHILDDFRPRLNVAISWLNEEWYNDRLYSQSRPNAEALSQIRLLPNYYTWTHRLLDALLPYLDARDSKLLIRFLSEIPAIDDGVMDRVKSLAKDPERIHMCMMAMQYLILMRPPVRVLVIDTIEQIWRDDTGFKEAKATAGKVLGKWRPGVLLEAAATAAGGGNNGVKKEEAGNMEQLDNSKTNLNASSESSEVMPQSFKSAATGLVDPRKKKAAALGTKTNVAPAGFAPLPVSSTESTASF